MKAWPGWAEVLAAPPSPFPAFNTTILPAGSVLVRVHARQFRGDEFNPCLGGKTRFAPLAQPGGACLATLYAASTLEAAVFESVFHDVPHLAMPRFVRLQRVTSRCVSVLETTGALTLATLHEPDLNRLGVTRGDLIDTAPTAYDRTARWAEALHRATPYLAGLVWTSRRCDPAQAYVFFGDRVDGGALRVTARVVLGSSAEYLAAIRQYGARAGIVLTV